MPGRRKVRAKAQKLDEENEKETFCWNQTKEYITLSGKKIELYANIGSAADVGYVLENDAGGIGLFRSEFLYIGRNELPSEEEQFQAYNRLHRIWPEKR